MVLPSAALRVGAAPWAISAASPGTGWLWNSATKSAQLFRADWVDDETLQGLSATAEAELQRSIRRSCRRLRRLGGGSVTPANF